MFSTFIWLFLLIGTAVIYGHEHEVDEANKLEQKKHIRSKSLIPKVRIIDSSFEIN